MKLKTKKAVETALIIAAIAAAFLTVLLYCQVTWSSHIVEFEHVNWSSPDESNFVWRYGDYASYLIAPIHWIATVLLSCVYALFFLHFCNDYCQWAKHCHMEKIRQEIKKRKKMEGELKTAQNSLIILNAEYDRLPAPQYRSIEQQQYADANRAVYTSATSEVLERETELKYQDRRISCMKKKLRELA